MLGKENIGEQVADNQMDYVDAGSAIVDYENILSSEELQCGRNQERPRVTRSSSIGSSSTSTDDEEMFSCISITSDEIVKKASFFLLRLLLKNSRKNYLNVLKKRNQVQKYVKQVK
ncbi:hypothetical protein [Wolbachia endosymbiont of Trichogramma pretiosum]|uniref:hypothetical protein n=1 Tax=Wolbachia endosymbiont of Trichogramma pretiosum TaxID=125593 RepID=UPI0009F9DBBC|nr:hypothetical protein [Wolbachia endosymbiont of Trichogramma pretiosum]OCA05857.1 hypothetical protein wTpre_175 [Wolbachia endosymbiont of Trichogramma pretiosum]